MGLSVNNRNQTIMELLNGTFQAIGEVVPIKHRIDKPRLLGDALNIQFGVLIGFIGDIRGKLVINGDVPVFGSIGEAMFGMAVEGEMLSSFTGELGNMIAGRLSTNISENGIKTDITSPTVMKGDTTLSGFEKALAVTIDFQNTGNMSIYLLLDK
ncbi:chemotaxis protein CheX [Fredinandcohnia quinoae]|uniref:Chemotaxis protein CheX n=1 Tax=Fredinandcohnia quinoae TaxID=2918902 RepID=A0AAW5ECY8_9BACI|nr:chemotaxis protein CheX [Fredinandcohnia sp. SECRCQ15]MCH1627772.1 chemotaxis protein CheX [Fredinandcohnia sp. SECRCQ15]